MQHPRWQAGEHQAAQTRRHNVAAIGKEEWLARTAVELQARQERIERRLRLLKRAKDRLLRCERCALRARIEARIELLRRGDLKNIHWAMRKVAAGEVY
jgi:hypothetical protein